MLQLRYGYSFGTGFDSLVECAIQQWGPQLLLNVYKRFPMPTALKIKLPREQLKPGEVLCDHCTAKCCRYFALPIETPKTRRDFDFIRWFLLHGRASVFTEDGTWYLLVHTACKHLQPDNRCGIYETRPAICREYSTNNCEYEDNWVYERYFETAEQIEEFADAVLQKSGNIRSRKPPLLPIVG
jgi:Fe-S-cluster containining protein